MPVGAIMAGEGLVVTLMAGAGLVLTVVAGLDPAIAPLEASPCR
jgi:hypothetical protein